jgi:hypothetical protein
MRKYFIAWKFNKYNYPEVDNKTVNEVTLINKTGDIEKMQ